MLKNGNEKKLQIAKRHRVSQNQSPEITTKNGTVK